MLPGAPLWTRFSKHVVDFLGGAGIAGLTAAITNAIEIAKSGKSMSTNEFIHNVVEAVISGGAINLFIMGIFHTAGAVSKRHSNPAGGGGHHEVPPAHHEAPPAHHEAPRPAHHEAPPVHEAPPPVHEAAAPTHEAAPRRDTLPTRAGDEPTLPAIHAPAKSADPKLTELADMLNMRQERLHSLHGEHVGRAEIEGRLQGAGIDPHSPQGRQIADRLQTQLETHGRITTEDLAAVESMKREPATPKAAPPVAQERTGKYVTMEDGYFPDRLFMDHIPGKIPSEGWKLHVSADFASAHEVADRVLPMLRKMGVNHKVMADPVAYGKMQGGQAGKFITIYADSAEHALAITKAVDSVVSGLSGPAVAGERAVGSSGLVFARYGGFTSDMIMGPNGTPVPDVRGQICPHWITDIFK